MGRFSVVSATVVGILAFVTVSHAVDKITDESVAWNWFLEYSEAAAKVSNAASKVSWAYYTNLTDYNQQQLLENSERRKTFTKEVARNASLFDFENFQNKTLAKVLKNLADEGWAALSDEEFTEVNKLSTELESLYSKAKLCKDGKTVWNLQPELTEKLASGRDADELLWIWKNWRDATGPEMREKYIRFIALNNKASVANGYEDTGADWREGYALEGYDFRRDIENLYNELKPFYKQLHIYMKNKLKEKYPSVTFPSSGHIPAHLLGNMWAQTWGNVEDIALPHQASAPVNATPALQQKTIREIFEMSDDFFTSLGLEPVTREFWDNSMLEKPTDGRDVVCHASAWDFSDKRDFRIKQCTRKNMEDFITVHHEMGHIQYYLQYKDQPHSFRRGANPGFHEAVGDVLALSVATPKHLKTVGLINGFATTKESDINYLMGIALDKIVFLPFGKLMDDYRWAVFDGTVTADNLNSEWWKRRCAYQGVSPPVKRSENDFDAGAKYHIPANVPYVRYFVSYILQFQFHKALCDAAGHTGPLHKCDIYQSRAAGKKLGDMLKLGSSQEWTVALEAITGSPNMTAQPLIDYFQPVNAWLTEYNNEHYPNDQGWTDECPTDIPEASTVDSGECEPDKITDESVAWNWFLEYSEAAAKVSNAASKVSWAYSTNITDYNQQQMLEHSEKRKTFTKEVARNASLFDFENFQNKTLAKALRYLADEGWAALSAEEFTEVNKLSAELESIYSKAKLCKDGKTVWNLEPELTEKLASGRDADELLWIWKNWRDATGPEMREKYLRFIALNNKASVANGYADTGADWREGYALDGYDFRGDIENLYNELKPFYKQLHIYVKNKLKEKYPSVTFPSSGHIPAHLLGNMWAQTWGNVEDIALPYQASAPVNATPALQQKTIREIFEMSDEFFTSLGLESVTQEFWDNSMLEKPTDGRDVVCHASAWDFSDKRDFRIKQCTRKNMEDFITVHHEMGHIQYYLQYKDQPHSFRGGANPGFHEAVGDVLALSVATPKHLKDVGLIDSFATTNESDINYLMGIALDKIVFLPFGKLMDDYRWAVFDGTVTADNLNSEWWKRRCSYQGVSPPVKRSENDFDAGAKYHIPANVPYVRYFVSYILQFQFHKALCEAAGHTGPLHKCDIYQSKPAGKKLGDMLKLGSSQEWTVALEAITGSPNMTAQPLIDYFQPVNAWLTAYNNEHYPNDQGWTDDCPTDIPEASTVDSGLGECKDETGASSVTQVSLLLTFNCLLTIKYLLY